MRDIPKGAALYVLGYILHDWDDESCVRILQSVREAMAPGSKLAVLEMVVEPMNEAGPAKDFDLVMLSALSGKERTRNEYAELFSAAGMKLAEVVPTGKPVSIILGECVLEG